ncbi:MAG: DUF1697 domain-containing protein [Clostridiales bacterium]|jgi:uncharacterized protein (DUF1697 family)|nr:DUF1697 domain-containing protein [Clostridiales bacterium]
MNSTKYIALLRGINVGGNNKISMPILKGVFEKGGLQNVMTYINSGNVIFESQKSDIQQVKELCEELILKNFNLKILVCIINASNFLECLSHAPMWWNTSKEQKHNALFVIPPLTGEYVFNQIGETKPEYESIAFFGNVIFWSAPIATYSHKRLSTIVTNKKVYNAVTIRNANTTLKLKDLMEKS